jgi:hypothetical protein
MMRDCSQNPTLQVAIHGEICGVGARQDRCAAWKRRCYLVGRFNSSLSAFWLECEVARHPLFGRVREQRGHQPAIVPVGAASRAPPQAADQNEKSPETRGPLRIHYI